MKTVHNHTIYNTLHHKKGGGFVNPLGSMRKLPFLKYTFWLFGTLLSQKNNIAPTIEPLPPEITDSPPSHFRISWLGHTTLLIQLKATNILTDPVLVPRLGPLYPLGPKRSAPLPIPLEDLPQIHTVLISHDHFEHLDEKSVKWLKVQHDPIFIVPLGIGTILRKWNIQNVIELDWWQTVQFEALHFSCLPANHWSGRPPAKYYQTLWCSWWLETEGSSIFFAGDTAYAKHFKEIASHLGCPDAAILPIGAYKPKWLHEIFHMNPAQAVQAFLDLGAKVLVPMHWGTFDISEETLQEPMALFLEEAKKKNLLDKAKIMTIGDFVER